MFDDEFDDRGPTLSASPQTVGTRARALLAAGTGNFVEWFDFAVYGQFATLIALHFFPLEDTTAGLLSTFAVYALGFFARPLGGVLFGHLGDRWGRRNTLIVGVLSMSGATFAIGVLPSYATLGAAAPALLVAFRVIQGVSGGGEYVGSSTYLAEFSLPGRRGVATSFSPASAALGICGGAVAGLLVTASMSEADVSAWGWRIPFLVAGPLGLVSLLLRFRLEDTPAFRRAQQSARRHEAPLVVVLREHRRAIALLFAWCAGNAVAFYVLSGFIVTYLTRDVGLDRSSALLSNAVGLFVMAVTCPLAGHLTDRFGRRAIAVVSACALMVAIVPVVSLLGRGDVVSALVAQCLWAAPLAGIATVTPLLMAELFTTDVRYTGSALGYNTSYALFGGTAPYLATWLVAGSGGPRALGVYLAAALLISALTAVFGLRAAYRADPRGTAELRDREAGPVHTLDRPHVR
jgi:MHS family proline/betaine transporter-like MFS transporter